EWVSKNFLINVQITPDVIMIFTVFYPHTHNMERGFLTPPPTLSPKDWRGGLYGRAEARPQGDRGCFWC
ncbi:MAG TPA: hypothetical protein PLZ51_10910, partial [Aggregatilineales bacterium]|nr:hypothetical protein [Aggregatilineales bacterium]